MTWDAALVLTGTFRMIWLKRSERRGCQKDAQWRPVTGFFQETFSAGWRTQYTQSTHGSCASSSFDLTSSCFLPFFYRRCRKSKIKRKGKVRPRSSNHIKHGKAAELCRPVRWVSLHWLHLNSSHPLNKKTCKTVKSIYKLKPWNNEENKIWCCC